MRRPMNGSRRPRRGSERAVERERHLVGDGHGAADGDQILLVVAEVDVPVHVLRAAVSHQGRFSSGKAVERPWNGSGTAGKCAQPKRWHAGG